ncbi:hypothetical protein Q4520_16375 [Alteromonas sp. 1_MG-2023]|uniref:hypothetical protein n=1 Tax=Alteromonas sp. 1_MG-2023 TaxID=3062669 RepID=UPI0026E3162B|nr:hypothetical protein [Alteromonas sp. 1_MG-2023]MDO6477002.1 hypothetical protein [Alteromonas sp. 1_MG-2023]
MKAKTLLTSLVLTAAMLSSQAMAQESAVESFLGRLIDQAVSMAGEEISNGVRQSVANATYNFSLPDETKTGSVSVTDLAASGTQSKSEYAESEEE